MLFDLLGRKHNNPFPRPADSPGFGCHRPLIASFLDTPPSSLPRFNCTLWLFITIHTDPAFQARKEGEVASSGFVPDIFLTALSLPPPRHFGLCTALESATNFLRFLKAVPAS